MKIMEIASIFLGIAIIIATVVGVFSFVSGNDDNPTEEAAEEVVESLVENALNLPDGTLNIDLSPGSEEKEKE